jgi:putative ABC transport system ATP-binding protein
VSRRYATPSGWVNALGAVDLAADAGSLVALVGPSGSGKSTLLRILAGIDPATTGEIVVERIDVRSLNGAGLRRYLGGTVAYLAQRAAANLVPHLTVREQLGGHPAPDLGLDGRVDAPARKLSGGEQARAALAIGISRGTPVLLLDEPTAELDRRAAAVVVDALRAAAAGGRTVVVATHDPDVIAIADSRLDLTGVLPGAVQRASARLPGEVALAADDVVKSYSGRRVLDGASLELSAGEVGALIGRSGSGKSTLLMVLAGFLRLDSGSVRTPGAAWAQTAYLPQRFGLLPELSLAENVALPRRLAGLTDDVSLLMERFQLGELDHRLPRETSVGQQQRAALARALAIRPALVLADEPTSHQDPRSAESVWAMLAGAAAEGAACLVATHDAAAAARADRVWHIEDGRIGSTMGAARWR